jgi:hypothetical protein
MSTDPAPYRVSFLAAARERVKRCARTAILLGIGREYAATLRFIIERLSTSPLTWGEPSHHYRLAKLVQRKMIFQRVLVIYVVHEDQPIVFVKECKPVLGHPLESA